MINNDSDNILKTAWEVDQICSYVLEPLDISYFQFKRTYKNKSHIILANNLMFFEEFLEDGFIEPKVRQPLNIRQTHFCFWDETLPSEQLSYLKDTLNVYHGLTILNRHKEYYDCTSFAMSKHDLSPVAHYLFALKDLLNFVEIFSMKARHLIKEATTNNLTKKPIGNESSYHPFFLPKRSVRYYLSKDPGMYITTYEAFCVQLAHQGKTYKEIGSILSMEPGTVKTLLFRLKARTGLSLQEVALQLLHAHHTSKSNFVSPSKEQHDSSLKRTKDA